MLRYPRMSEVRASEALRRNPESSRENPGLMRAPVHHSLRTLLFRSAVICVAAAVILCSSSLSAHELPRTDSVYIPPMVVKAWLDEGQAVVFLDVRKPEEFHAGHLIGAKNIIFDQVASLADELPHDRPIVTYCIHSAHRAPVAARTLRQLGVANAYVLEGGIVAWEAGGLSIRASDLAHAPRILPQPDCICSGPDTP